jgi:chromosome partitioning protein
MRYHPVMIVTVANFKGGVAKTTTAIHFATYLQRLAPTILFDSDPNRAALAWNRNQTLPFAVADIRQATRLAGEYTHKVIDSEARPGADDFKALAETSDMLVIPAVPGTLDTLALVQTVNELRQLKNIHYRVLLVMVPANEPDARQLRAELAAAGVPLFTTQIPQLKAFERAAALGVPVCDVKADPRAPRAWEAYEAAAKEMIEETVEVPA